MSGLSLVSTSLTVGRCALTVVDSEVQTDCLVLVVPSDPHEHRTKGQCEGLCGHVDRSDLILRVEQVRSVSWGWRRSGRCHSDMW